MAEIKDFSLARAAREAEMSEPIFVGASNRVGALHFLMTRPPGESDFVELRNDAGERIEAGEWSAVDGENFEPLDVEEVSLPGGRLLLWAFVIDRWPAGGENGALHFVTKRPPDAESDFVDLENGIGQSVGNDVAQWRELPGGLWDLVVPSWP